MLGTKVEFTLATLRSKVVAVNAKLVAKRDGMNPQNPARETTDLAIELARLAVLMLDGRIQHDSPTAIPFVEQASRMVEDRDEMESCYEDDYECNCPPPPAGYYSMCMGLAALYATRAYLANSENRDDCFTQLCRYRLD